MALRRSLAGLALALRQTTHQSLHASAGCIENGLAAGLAVCRVPPSLHRCASPFTSLRLFGARRECFSAPALGQQGGGRQLSTATASPGDSDAPVVATPLAPGDVVAGETLEEIRARVFGTHIGNGLRSGRKVLRGKLLGPKIAAYYPEDMRKGDPLMLSLKAERAKAKLDRMRRRGKAPPKKGAGKRSKKK